MARLRFTPGTRYLRNEQIFLVRQVLAAQRLLVDNQSVGGQDIASQDELIAAWGDGALQFEVQGVCTVHGVEIYALSGVAAPRNDSCIRNE